MAWITNNWSLLVVVLCAVGVCFLWMKKFANLPTEVQLDTVRKWLLYAVLRAEKEMGSGTGKAKLVYTYNLFVERFSSLVPLISFEMFSGLVDEVLVEMRKILETNKDIDTYINGD